MSTDQQLPECETAGDEEEIDCWNCEDRGFFVTVGDIQMPCPDCKTGDMFFAHNREVVHVDDGLGEQAEDELEAWERSRD
jgi:hypothetical protein